MCSRPTDSIILVAMVVEGRGLPMFLNARSAITATMHLQSLAEEEVALPFAAEARSS